MKTAILIVCSLVIGLAGRAATLTVTDDSSISSASPDQKFGSAGVLNVGAGNTALIKLNLTSLQSDLDPSNIQQATLTVFVNQVITAGALNIAPVTTSWSESTVTYNTPLTFGSVLNKQPVPVTLANTYVTFDITSLVTSWLSHTTPADGVVITGAAGTAVGLDSKESTATSHPPYAEVTITGLGPQGPAGANGATGGSGLPGPQGPAGIQGPQGLTGPTGSQGPHGAQGAQGSAGPQGIVGLDGPLGPQGAPGFSGMNWRGNWVSGTSYQINDAVTDNGSSYFALTSNSVQPSSNSSKWSLLAPAGPQGAAGVTIQNYFGTTSCSNRHTTCFEFNCPSGQYVTGIDQNGIPLCAAQTCQSTSFTAGLNSYSAISDSNSAVEEFWPAGSLSFGAGSCTASITKPSDSSGNDCLINSLSCQGWRNLTKGPGFGSCTLTVSNPVCNSAAAIANVNNGTFPGCTVAFSNGSQNNPHSEDHITIQCNP